MIPFEKAPAMKSVEITDHLVAAMASGKFQFLRCNYPNGDMVGHTGVIPAVISAMESIGGGWVTFSGKFCTEYGIATTAARMAHIVLHDEKAIMPASAELCGEYGESGLFAGVPCVIGANGVEEVVELPLTEEEKATFHACCEGIRTNMEHLKDL